MHCARQSRSLPGDDAPWFDIAVSQPGERRDPRLAYSIGNKYFLPLAVIGDGLRIPETGHGRAGRRSADHPFGMRVARGRAVERYSRVISEIGYPDLIVLGVIGDSHRPRNAGSVAG